MINLLKLFGVTEEDKTPSQPPVSHIKKVRELEESGALNEVREMIKNKSEAWIRRSSGEWQMVEIIGLIHAGQRVFVTWLDQKTDKYLTKAIETDEFLGWQREKGIENNREKIAQL